MQPWIQAFPADQQRVRELVAKLREQIGIVDNIRHAPRADDDPQLWWDMGMYQKYLLDDARIRGFDHHDGMQLCDLELLALLQHNGAATHLLDLSRDVTTPLWFAASECPETTGVHCGIRRHGHRTLVGGWGENRVWRSHGHAAGIYRTSPLQQACSRMDREKPDTTHLGPAGRVSSVRVRRPAVGVCCGGWHIRVE